MLFLWVFSSVENTQRISQVDGWIAGKNEGISINEMFIWAHASRNSRRSGRISMVWALPLKLADHSEIWLVPIKPQSYMISPPPLPSAPKCHGFELSRNCGVVEITWIPKMSPFYCLHWNEIVGEFVFADRFHLANSSATDDENFINMMTSPFHGSVHSVYLPVSPASMGPEVRKGVRASSCWGVEPGYRPRSGPYLQEGDSTIEPLWSDHLISWTSYQICQIASCACAGNAGNVFPATDFKINC